MALKKKNTVLKDNLGLLGRAVISPLTAIEAGIAGSLRGATTGALKGREQSVGQGLAQGFGGIVSGFGKGVASSFENIAQPGKTESFSKLFQDWRSAGETAGYGTEFGRQMGSDFSKKAVGVAGLIGDIGINADVGISSLTKPSSLVEGSFKMQPGALQKISEAYKARRAMKVGSQALETGTESIAKSQKSLRRAFDMEDILATGEKYDRKTGKLFKEIEKITDFYTPETGRVTRSTIDKIPLDIDTNLDRDVTRLMSTLTLADKPKTLFDTIKFTDTAADTAENVFTGVRDNAQAIKKSFVKEAVNSAPSKYKAGILEIFRTPINVLKDMGIGDDIIDTLQTAERNVPVDTSKDISRINEWYNQVKHIEGSEKRIFNFLDGKKVDLLPEELEVAEQIKTWYKDWAKKLDLPEDNIISDYVTHIWSDTKSAKDLPPEIAQIVKLDKMPKGVFNPFEMKRTGALNYQEDVWASLDAYAKRANRKYNFQPAIESLNQVAKKFDGANYDYVNKLIQRINLRPDKLDTLIDNTMNGVYKSLGMGEQYRPLAKVSKKVRQQIYRGGLGFNVTGAVRNLSQGANTFAELGTKSTLRGYTDLFRNWGDLSELEDLGLIGDVVSTEGIKRAIPNFGQKLDKTIFVLQELTEKINRGAAFYGGKAKWLAEHPNDIKGAIKYGLDVADRTQFRFGSLSEPLILNGDAVKTLATFQSYPIKQIEFLAGHVKNKNWGALFRYLLGSTAFYGTIGAAFGIGGEKFLKVIPKSTLDLIPDIQGGPLLSTIEALGQTAFGDEQTREQGKKTLGKNAFLVVPAGAQLRKTLQGIKAAQEGGMYNKRGDLKFPVEGALDEARAVVGGPYTTSGGQEYINTGFKPVRRIADPTIQQAADELREKMLQNMNTSSYEELLNKYSMNK